MITGHRSRRVHWGAQVSARALALGLGLGLTGGFIPMLVSAPSASASSYCSLGATLTKDESGVLNQSTASSSNFAAVEKKAFQNLLNYQSQIVSVAPSQLQAPFKATFNVLHEIYGQLSAVAFNPLKLSSSAQKALVTESERLGTDAQPIDKYNTSVCHLKS